MSEFIHWHTEECYLRRRILLSMFANGAAASLKSFPVFIWGRSLTRDLNVDCYDQRDLSHGGLTEASMIFGRIETDA
jgi:hypothetical protein